MAGGGTTPDQNTETVSSPSVHPPEAQQKWGTHIMGSPAVPTTHPENQKASMWKADDHQQQHPYVFSSPVDKPTTNPLDHLLRKFHSTSAKAEALARNVWLNLKTGPSISEAAMGKMNLGAKAMTGGGFESMFKQIFSPEADEHLKKTFACYLSTTTGPVAGTLYLSTCRAAFCSDRPLSFKAPSGQETWSYYKVVVPLGMMATMNPVVMRENSAERYIQVVTVDGHDFWFMGFVNFDKASHRKFVLMSKNEEPAIGIPYYVGENIYQSGMIPPTAIVGYPGDIPLQQTMYRDTPAPFNCVYCGGSGVTTVRSNPSVAALVGCMMPMMMGVCFLCPSMDCLWHKHHYCPHCNHKVADFEKTDVCIFMDPPHWTQPSFALPA